MTSICIVSHFAYGAMAGGHNGHTGGVERQTTMMARWLADRGHQVSLIVWNEGQPPDTMIDGVRVIAICRRDAGLPGVRFVHPRWTSLSRALRYADAEVYYQNCAESITGQVALWCRRHGRKFVYSVASDPECDPRLPALSRARERILFRYGLRRADRILVQTETQRVMLREGSGLEGLVLPMPCPGPSEHEFRALDPPDAESPRVVWIGRVSAEKRLSWLVTVASALPNIRFEIVGAPAPGDHEAEAVVRRAEALPNVNALGKVPRQDMPKVYRGASLLLCTSAYEGFPNTFLEAWSHGVPVVSTVDPDRLIANRGLGAVAEDSAGLIAGIRQCLASPEAWRSMSTRARAFYAESHVPERALPRFEQVFVDVAQGKVHR